MRTSQLGNHKDWPCAIMHCSFSASIVSTLSAHWPLVYPNHGGNTSTNLHCLCGAFYERHYPFLSPHFRSQFAFHTWVPCIRIWCYSRLKRPLLDQADNTAVAMQTPADAAWDPKKHGCMASDPRGSSMWLASLLIMCTCTHIDTSIRPSADAP